MAARRQVIILGGGLAGLSAAVPLAEAGFQVTLIERKPFLGGRAASYPIPLDRRPRPEAISGAEATGGSETFPFSSADRLPPREEREYVDNCQHILLKCCTNLLDFYRRLGVEQGIAFYNRYLFLDERGRLATLSSSRLPAPLHLAPSFWRFAPLGWKDKLAVAYAFFCMLREQKQVKQLDRVTMSQWLQQHGQSAKAIQGFWRLILVSALNEDIEIASARYGLKVFLDGLLRHRQAFHMGIPTVPLSQLYTEPSLKFLQSRDGMVRLRSSATRIEVEATEVHAVVLSDGTRLTGDYYVSSLPPEVLVKLLPEEAVERFSDFAKLRRFETSPITAIYLWFDREITNLEYAALMGREIQWIFNKTANFNILGKPASSYLGLVVSASRRLLPLERSAIVEIALRDLREVLPSVREATLLGSVVIKEPFATFSCRAGCDEFRPDQKSSLENFLLAGDWTNTGWPPTMEGAVRSGYRCAELILSAEGKGRSLIQPDLPVEGLARWIS